MVLSWRITLVSLVLVPVFILPAKFMGRRLQANLEGVPFVGDSLGDLQAARELDEDTLARRRRVLGEDHPDTLTSASNLAADLCALGET